MLFYHAENVISFCEALKTTYIEAQCVFIILKTLSGFPYLLHCFGMEMLSIKSKSGESKQIMTGTNIISGIKEHRFGCQTTGLESKFCCDLA